eukprot:GHVN01094343.1.p1 GENE.GHVN01094343.1~~GHVN01094343.1.p1  ORF type:complete len:135 (+),score=14.06 GHVN01094343.1:27-407(+)
MTLCAVSYYGLTEFTNLLHFNFSVPTTQLNIFVILLGLVVYITPIFIYLRPTYTKEIKMEIEERGYETRVSVAIIPTTHATTSEVLGNFNPSRHTHFVAGPDMFERDYGRLSAGAHGGWRQRTYYV